MQDPLAISTDYRKIYLPQGMFAMVDICDYDYLNKFKWQLSKDVNNCYATRRERIDGKLKNIRMHRDLLKVSDRKLLVDHADKNGLNNTRSNLRICNNSQNSSNRRAKKRLSTKYIGIDWNKNAGKWRARVILNGEFISAGYYKLETEAALAYNYMAFALKKEFASLNDIYNPDNNIPKINYEEQKLDFSIDDFFEIPDTGGVYKISRGGIVLSLNYYQKKIPHLLKQRVDKYGYLTSRINNKNNLIHRLVAKTFIPNPENKPCVNHINGIKTDNRVENLEWNTVAENNLHRFRTGLCKMSKSWDRSDSKAVVQLDLNGSEVSKFGSLMEAQRETGFFQSCISNSIRMNRPHGHYGQQKYIWKWL